MELIIVLGILWLVLLACVWIDRRTDAEMKKPEYLRNPTICPPKDDDV